MVEDDVAPLIVCFGDSLTAGFQSPIFGHSSAEDAPYGAFLQRRLGALARVSVSGICGERTGDMVQRFQRDVLAHAPSWVVILGGTNDLGGNASPEAIMRNLTQMYALASDQGIRPVAVTVPSIRAGGGPADAPPGPTRAGGSPVGAPPAPTDHISLEARQWIGDHIARRRALNGLIKDYCMSERMACLDLFTETAEPGSFLLAAPYSNDGLHLTSRGYERFATLLYEQIFAPALAKGTRQGADRS